jgi:hypothetical protein
VRLAGAAWGRQDELEEVARRALGGASADRVVVSLAPGVTFALAGLPVIDLDPRLGHAPAAAGVLASVAAVEWIRRGTVSAVLVVCSGPDSGSVALSWARS